MAMLRSSTTLTLDKYDSFIPVGHDVSYPSPKLYQYAGSGTTTTIVALGSQFQFSENQVTQGICTEIKGLNDQGTSRFDLRLSDLDITTLLGKSQAEQLALIFAGDDDILCNTGSSYNDIIHSYGGNDLLNGGTGADAMWGGTGNDVYTVDNALDAVNELSGEGLDKVLSSITHTLSDNVEQLTLTGKAVIDGTGNRLANVITGNVAANVLSGGGGNDTLEGGLGRDTLIGGTGSDTYIVRDTGDVITELSGEGIDTVKAAISYTLTADNVERLYLVGKGAIDATGNASVNTVRGNKSDNHIDGGDGRDVLTGFGGHDTFDFSTALGENNVDRITDFDPADDAIGLDGGVFSGLAFTGSGGSLAASQFASLTADDVAHNVKYGASVHIIYRADKGALYYDADGYGGTAKAIQFAVLDGAPALDAHHVHLLMA